MGNNLPPDLGAGTILQAAKYMAKELLRTLSAQDYVNIIVYDSSRVIQLSPSGAVLVQEHNGTEATELESLRTELDKQTVESQNRQSNLSAAILAALPNFDANSQAAKEIVVITDGAFATLRNVTLPTAELSNSRVMAFMNKLKQPQDNDIFLKINTLTYNWFANIISVSKPVFLEENLIGVAGITIHIEALGNITDQVKPALRSRITEYSLAAPNAANCSLVSETLQPCGNSTRYYAQNGFLCKRADSRRSTIQELTCCGPCSAPHRDQPGHLGTGPIIGIVLGVLALVSIMFVKWYKNTHQDSESDFMKNYPSVLMNTRLEKA